MCSTTIKNGMVGLHRIVPEVNIIISPMLYTASNIQDSYVGLKNAKTSNLGCWNAFLYVNERTDKLHMEHDYTFICITVPENRHRIF